MFNKLKHLTNKLIGTSLCVDVIVNSPKMGHYYGYISEIPKKGELVFVFAIGNEYEIIQVDSVIKLGNVYHIKSEESDYTIRIM